MATFPDGSNYKPLIGYESGELENVRRTPAESGASQQRDCWGVTRFWAAMEFEQDLSYANEIIAFRRDNRATSFDFFDFDPNIFNEEMIGTGDGVTTTFTIPAKETSSQTVEVADGVGGWTARTAGVHYNISVGTGALGQDRVIFTGGNIPATGRTVRISYTGRHHYECEWDGPIGRRTISSTGRKHLSLRLREAF